MRDDENAGRMTDAVRASLLRGFTAREAELTAQAATTPTRWPWRWQEGIALFPEGVCPLCRAAIVSNRIWHVGVRTLHCQFRLEAARDGQAVGRIVREAPEHPHVVGTQVCTGRVYDQGNYGVTNALGTTLAALFLGITPADTYWGRGPRPIPDWLLKMFDHVCGQEGRVVQVQCVNCPGMRAEGLPHNCDAVPCGCSCRCVPAGGHCGCSCLTCRCDRRAEERAAGNEPPALELCGHECCRDCCTQRAYCNTDAAWTAAGRRRTRS